ncbi:MAG: hypothetical protein GXP31_13565 [Kiritimatiellaeota bacterium]|nr:hypothetical protein [Kiritimatiellota bacterium]
MTVADVKAALDAEIIGAGDPETVVLRACACDLLSDVLRCVTREKAILLTNLTHLQTVRVAEMVDAAAVCYMRGKRPGDDVIRLAEEKGMVLLTTKMTSYEASGQLCRLGLSGCEHD